jgi:hypothetical protein
MQRANDGKVVLEPIHFGVTADVFVFAVAAGYLVHPRLNCKMLNRLS